METENIQGLNQYRPGHDSVKNLGIKLTSSTTRTKPKIIIIKNSPLPDRVKNYDSHCSSVLRINHKRTSQLNRINQTLRYAPLKRIITLNPDDLAKANIHKILEDFGATEIVAVVSLLEHILYKFRNSSINSPFSKVTRIVTEGEMTTKRHEKNIKIYAPKAALFPEYGLSESDVCMFYDPKIAEEFGENRFNTFHPFSTTRIKIKNPDEEGYGEIIISTPQYKNLHTGDKGILLKKESTGYPHDTLIVQGRINFDVIGCVGAVFLIQEVERVFNTLQMYVSDFFIEISEIEERGKLYGKVSISVEPKTMLLEHADSESYIAEEFNKRTRVTKTRTLKQLIDESIFLPTTVRLVEKIPQNKNKKKIRMRKV